MTLALATSQLPSGIAAGDVLVALGAASPADAWIKLSPRGETVTRNGAHYHFDPEQLAARFAADDVKIAVDFDHGIAKLASRGERVDAIGWVEEMQPRPDGLYGRVDWLDAGKAALAARTHRYVSPTFHHDDAGRATWMHSVALVTAPALSRMPALASADPHAQEHTMSKQIATALGLAETADEAACLAAIGTLKTGAAPAGTVAKAVHDTTLATLAATTAELDGLKAANRKAEVDALLDGALQAKKIVPAQRDQFASLCATDDGLKHVKALLAATPAGLQASGLDSQTAAADLGDAAEVDPVALAAEGRKLVAAAAATGTVLTIQDAIAQLRAPKKKG